MKQDDDWWIGRIEEVAGVSCKEASPDELIETLDIKRYEKHSADRSATP